MSTECTYIAQISFTNDMGQYSRKIPQLPPAIKPGDTIWIGPEMLDDFVIESVDWHVDRNTVQVYLQDIEPGPGAKENLESLGFVWGEMGC